MRLEGVRRGLIAGGAAAVVAAFVSSAHASQLVDRNATHVTLRVNAAGEALIVYQVKGRVRRVLAWGGVNAIAPTRTRPRVAFKLDYSGGYGKYHRDYWRTFEGSCGSYDGPPLAWQVAACKAPDGSYWALQAWQRMLPNYGADPARRNAPGSSASRTGPATCRR